MTSSSTDELLLQLHNAALSDMQTSRPKNLTRALAYQAEELAPEAAMSATEGALREALERALPTDRLVEMWRKKLTDWDFAPTPSWSDSAERTEARRGHVYDLLGLSEESRKLLDNLIPVSKVEAPVVITDEFTPWYTPESQHGRPWYWPSYRSHLEGKGWTPEAVAGLDVATDAVVERLADPTQTVTYQAKGLVVGYVQSGKTANFTGVIAKAVDAGYRLVIVLGGTLNMLRAQTQRRLDMELVGRENILRGASEYESDYASDPAWAQGKFVTFGALPSSLGAFDIVRLTTFDDDYKSLLQGITALEQEKQEPALPLFDPRNLHRSAARLMIVKKNKSVLTKLVNDLKKLKTPLAEIPVLIIDDESDEASVNTANLAKPDAERPAINGKISELLRMLPRAQYVGYTATPFANVFVDPSDAEDIFPKDFIVSLPRPQGYMGARDFHDLDSVIPDEGATVANSNELAHVRSITLDGEEADDICLQRAMDTFVLTGAMKLYREAEGGSATGTSSITPCSSTSPFAPTSNASSWARCPECGGTRDTWGRVAMNVCVNCSRPTLPACRRCAPTVTPFHPRTRRWPPTSVRPSPGSAGMTIPSSSSTVTRTSRPARRTSTSVPSGRSSSAVRSWPADSRSKG